MARHHTLLILCTLGTGWLAGCTTPVEVKELAKVTAGNASRVSTELNRFRDTQLHLANIRTQSVAVWRGRMKAHQREFDSFVDSAEIASRISGTDKKPSFSLLIETLRHAADAEKLRQQAQQAKTVKAEAPSLRDAFKIPNDSLGDISTRLAALAKPSDPKESFELFKTFFSEVVSGIKKAREEAEKSAEKLESRAAEGTEN